MFKKLLLLILLLACFNIAHSQTPGTFGTTINNASGFGAGSQNFLLANYIVIGAQPVGTVTCTVVVTSGGTTGGHIDCILLTAPTSTTQGTSALCHATITETGASGTYPVSLTGCGPLTAGEALWLGTDMNDSTAILGTMSCTCTGPAGSGLFNATYTSLTYGTYTGIPSSPSGTDSSYQGTVWITTTPSNTNIIQGYGSMY